MYYNDSGRNAPETGTNPGAILFESPQRPRSDSSGTGSTILTGPAGALGLVGVSTTAHNDNL